MTECQTSMSGARHRDRQADFFLGARLAVPAMLASAPFGMLVGAMAVEHGLSVAEALFMSVALFAGASQLVGVELFAHDVPIWLVLASIVAVNFRLILYSAGMTPYAARWTLGQKAIAFHLLTDVQFAEISRHGEAGTPITFPLYMGFGVLFVVNWILLTWVGAVFGKLIRNPEMLGLDYLVTVYFLGMVMGFRHRPRWIPVVASSAFASVLADHLIGSPWNITFGAVVGIAAAIVLAWNSEASEDEA